MYSMWTKVTSQLWQVVFVNFSDEPIIYWPKSWKNGFIRVINNSKMVKSRVMVSRIVYWERSEQIMGIWLNKLSHFLQIVINNLLTYIYKLITRRKGGWLGVTSFVMSNFMNNWLHNIRHNHMFLNMATNLVSLTVAVLKINNLLNLR